MQKIELIEALDHAYKRLTHQLSNYTEEELHFSMQGKWSAAQQAQHLYKSIRPVKIAFSIPKFILKMLFGKANRASKSYDELLLKYQVLLSKGGTTSAPFIPAKAENINITGVINGIDKSIFSLNHFVQKKTEEELDFYILPHPLFGKLTMREMLYFSIFHAYHHQQSIKNLVAKMNDYKL